MPTGYITTVASNLFAPSLPHYKCKCHLTKFVRQLRCDIWFGATTCVSHMCYHEVGMACLLWHTWPLTWYNHGPNLRVNTCRKQHDWTQVLTQVGTGVKSIRDSDVIGTANKHLHPHCVVPYSVTTGSWAHPRLLYHSAKWRAASFISIHLQLVC